MKELGLVSNYTVTQFKLHKFLCNASPRKNELQREFRQVQLLNVIVSNLTYVCVGEKWKEEAYHKERTGRSVADWWL